MTMPSAPLPDEITRLEASARLTRTPVGDGAMSWREWGDGEELMLLHGSHGGWMHWLRNIPALAQVRRVIVPDIPGFAESDPPADLDDPADHARAVAQGLRAIGVNAPVDVVGFSFGALIAALLALEAPDLVRRIIIVDAGGLDTPLRTADKRKVKGLSGQELRDANRHNLASGMFHDPALIDETAIDIAMFCGRRVRTRAQLQVIPDKLLPVIGRVRVPVDAIWGACDYIHPDPELNLARVREHQPDAQLRVIQDAGHWSMYEQPERFNASLLDLLSRPVRPFAMAGGTA